MATYHGQTVDIVECFNSSPGDASLDWSETGGVTFPASDYVHEGAGSFRINHASMPAIGAVNWWGGAHGHHSIGWWFRVTGSAGASTSLGQLYNSGWDRILNIFANDLTASGYTFYMQFADGTAYDYAATQGAWYWITMQFGVDNYSHCNLYDASHNLLLSHTQADTSSAMSEFSIGPEGQQNEDMVTWYDELVIDYTTAAFPLLGWDTYAASSIPAIMHHRKMQGVA